jgi:hypothetical protein
MDWSLQRCLESARIYRPGITAHTATEATGPLALGQMNRTGKSQLRPILPVFIECFLIFE